jgi:hypothetical protein
VTNEQTLDFSAYIADRTKDFTGREWVFAEIDRWLAVADAPRTFLLVGAPGSGKTVVAARLVQMSLGQVASDPYPRLSHDALTCFHFCQANSDATLNPLRFVEALSQALANRYDVFRDALLKKGDRNITINATQSVTTAASGSQVQNVVIEVHIGAMSARSAFDSAVRSPLEALVASGFDQPLVVLVDSLDEALTFPGDENLVALLRSTSDLPRQVRFILTSRSDKRVTAALSENSLDLINDAPTDVDDVCAYVEARLHARTDPLRLDFARRVAEVSQGNFLWARYKLDEAIPRLENGEAPSAIKLPAGLDGIYREFLQRELTGNQNKWEDLYRPLLGLLVVTHGEGLTAKQLAGISELKCSQIDNGLLALSHYLVRPLPDGPFQFYHQSFREFLLEDSQYHVYKDEANQKIGEYFYGEYRSRWRDCEDEYALRYTFDHLFDASCDEETLRLVTDGDYCARLVETNGARAYELKLAKARGITKNRGAKTRSRRAQIALFIAETRIGWAEIALAISQSFRRSESVSAGIAQRFTALEPVTLLQCRQSVAASAKSILQAAQNVGHQINNPFVDGSNVETKVTPPTRVELSYAYFGFPSGFLQPEKSRNRLGAVFLFIWSPTLFFLTGLILRMLIAIANFLVRIFETSRGQNTADLIDANFRLGTLQVVLEITPLTDKRAEVHQTSIFIANRLFCVLWNRLPFSRQWFAIDGLTEYIMSVAAEAEGDPHLEGSSSLDQRMELNPGETLTAAGVGLLAAATAGWFVTTSIVTSPIIGFSAAVGSSDHWIPLMLGFMAVTIGLYYYSVRAEVGRVMEKAAGHPLPGVAGTWLIMRLFLLEFVLLVTLVAGHYGLGH